MSLERKLGPPRAKNAVLSLAAHHCERSLVSQQISFHEVQTVIFMREHRMVQFPASDARSDE
jgi:hypothetical protein